MRKILRLVLAVLMVITLMGCNSTPASEKPAANTPVADTPATGEKVIRIAGESWHITKLFIEEAAAAFEADHPGVKVDVQTYADPTVVSNYAIDWAAGSTPVDMVLIDGAQFVQQFVAKDLIYDMEKDLDFFASKPMEEFVPSSIEMSRLNGNLYVIPLISEVTCININTKLFKEAGLVDAEGNALTPKAWEEFHDFAKKLTKKNADGTYEQYGAVIQWNKDMHGTVLGTLQAINGTIYKEDGVTIDFNNQAFADVMNVWKEGIRDGSFATEIFADTEAGRNGYKGGNVAMLVETSGRWIEGGNEFGMENVSVCALPGDKGTCGYVNGVFMPKCGQNADLCVEFIQNYLLAEGPQTGTLNDYGKLPVITEFFDMATAADWANIKGSLNSACTYPAYQESSKLQEEMRTIIQEGLMSDDDVSVTLEALQTMVEGLKK